MAAQAESERERRAKVINALGEFEAAEKLTEAAALIAQQPAALQLRYLHSMKEIASEHTSTIIVPLPLDLITPFLQPKSPAPAETQKQLPSSDGESARAISLTPNPERAPAGEG